MKQKTFSIFIFFLLVLAMSAYAYEGDSSEYDSGFTIQDLSFDANNSNYTGDGNQFLTEGDGNSTNYTHSFKLTYDETLPPAEEESSGGSGGSGSSSGGGGSLAVGKGITQSFYWDVTKKEDKTIATITKEGIGIMEIELPVKDVLNDVQLSVTKLFEVPKTEKKNKFTSYQYLEIVTKNLEQKSFSDIVTLKFSVSKEWLERKGATKDKVVLRRYVDDWTDLETWVIGENETHFLYQAKTPGFSFFVISVVEVDLRPDQNQEIVHPNKNITDKNLVGGATDNLVPVEDLSDNLQKAASSSFDWIWIVMPLVLVVVIVVFALKLKMPTPKPKIKEMGDQTTVPESSYFSCRKFIFKMRLSGASDADIKVTLKDKGWNEEQLDYVFTRLENEER